MTIVVSISEVSVWAKTEEDGIWPLSATWDTWLSPALQRSCFMLITKLLGMRGITITEGDFCVGGNSMIQIVSSALRKKYPSNRICFCYVATYFCAFLCKLRENLTGNGNSQNTSLVIPLS